MTLEDRLAPLPDSRIGRVLPALAIQAILGCSKKPSLTTSGQKSTTTPLGNFEVESGVLLIVDPGFTQDQINKLKSLAVVVPRARIGTWSLAVKYVTPRNDARRSAELHVRHGSFATTEGVPWQRQTGLIGVDYGQVGVFDAKYFRKDEVVPKNYRWKQKPLEPGNPWYSLCCDQTLDSAEAGVVPFGAVSSSGFGDGAYEWDLIKDPGGEVVAIRVVFIPE